MRKKLEIISSWLLGIGLVGHIFSYFFWSFVELVNIYYVSMYFLFVNCGLVLMLTGRGRAIRFVSVAMFTFSGQFLIMEFIGDPQDWKIRDVVILIMNFGSAMIISHLIDKHKKKIQL